MASSGACGGVQLSGRLPLPSVLLQPLFADGVAEDPVQDPAASREVLGGGLGSVEVGGQGVEDIADDGVVLERAHRAGGLLQPGQRPAFRAVELAAVRALIEVFTQRRPEHAGVRRAGDVPRHHGHYPAQCLQDRHTALAGRVLPAEGRIFARVDEK